MNKHTPGPWNNYQGGDIYCVYDQNGKKICTIEPVDIVGWNAVHREQAEANEVLITAAPDLLEALELWLSDYDEWASNPDFEPHPHVAERVAKTRAAIAKARGQS